MKERYIKYDEALTDNEILLFSQIINQFKDGEIDFPTLRSLFLNNDVMIQPILRDFSKKKMTISEAEVIKKRISEQQYRYSDIDCFILNSSDFKNVLFRMGYKAIELLANSGNSKYQEAMISILMTQLRNSYDKDEKLAVQRAKWRRRITELKSELSKKDVINKSK
ncbi:MAG: hypothetical protein IJI22_02885 [Bacilli bacterium]|nr:hypothetical protein [Bacilli bacterium]